MKKRLLLVLAMVVALSLVATAAVSAKSPNHQKQPPSGVQVMVLNNNPDPPPAPRIPGFYGCEEISWFGTIVIDGKTFGMALYSDYGYFDPPESPFYFYGEDWKIFTGKFKTKDGVLKRCAPGRVLMAGYAEGSVVFAPEPPFYFESKGTVDYAAGYFKWWDGYDVYQNGLIGPGVSVAGLVDAFGFHGNFETDLPLP
jgi:hypothetical protein